MHRYTREEGDSQPLKDRGRLFPTGTIDRGDQWIRDCDQASGNSCSQEHDQAQRVQKRPTPALRLILQPTQRGLDCGAERATENIERQQHHLIAARVIAKLSGAKPQTDDNVVQLAVKEIDDPETGQVRAEVQTAAHVAPVRDETRSPWAKSPDQR